MSNIDGRQIGEPRSTRLCPRTNKPLEVCCVGKPWSVMTSELDFRTYGEPLPQIVIDVALEWGLAPHDVMDDIEDRGWETHDKGFDEQVRMGALRLDEGRWWRHVGKMIAAHRQSIGLTQRGLGEQCGLGRTSIANLEAGRQHVSAWTLARIANVIGVQVCLLTPCEHRKYDDFNTKGI